MGSQRVASPGPVAPTSTPKVLQGAAGWEQASPYVGSRAAELIAGSRELTMAVRDFECSLHGPSCGEGSPTVTAWALPVWSLGHRPAPVGGLSRATSHSLLVPALEAALAGRTTGVGVGAPGILTCVGYRGRPPVAMTMCSAESRVWEETEKAAVTQAPHRHLARAPLCPSHAAALRRP